MNPPTTIATGAATDQIKWVELDAGAFKAATRYGDYSIVPVDGSTWSVWTPDTDPGDHAASSRHADLHSAQTYAFTDFSERHFRLTGVLFASQAEIDVLRERRRQVLNEGWTASHDDEYEANELSLASAAYSMSAAATGNNSSIETAQAVWPFDRGWFKPADQRTDMIKSVALGLAQIEALDRVK